MEEIDIWRSAALLLRQHGEAAELHAAHHMQAMIARGDSEGEGVWKRVRLAIRSLQEKHAVTSSDRQILPGTSQ